jgi:hypothetical protein
LWLEYSHKNSYNDLEKGGKMNSYIFAAVVLYTAWAIYSGYKYVNGRYQWLEQPEIAHRICKYVAILGMGYIVGAGTIVKWAVVAALRMADHK